MCFSSNFTALFCPYIPHKQTAQNFILSVRSSIFFLLSAIAPKIKVCSRAKSDWAMYPALIFALHFFHQTAFPGPVRESIQLLFLNSCREIPIRNQLSDVCDTGESRFLRNAYCTPGDHGEAVANLNISVNYRKSESLKGTSESDWKRISSLMSRKKTLSKNLAIHLFLVKFNSAVPTSILKLTPPPLIKVTVAKWKFWLTLLIW